jgi:hypothetical protein
VRWSCRQRSIGTRSLFRHALQIRIPRHLNLGLTNKSSLIKPDLREDLALFCTTPTLAEDREPRVPVGAKDSRSTFLPLPATTSTRHPTSEVRRQYPSTLDTLSYHSSRARKTESSITFATKMICLFLSCIFFSNLTSLLGMALPAPKRLQQLLQSEMDGTRKSEMPILLPCCYDGLTARLVTRAGFEATFMTGFGVSGSYFNVWDIISYVQDACR